MNINDYLWPEPGRRFFDFRRTRPDAYTWMNPSLGEYAHMYLESALQLMGLACDAPGLLNVHAMPGVFLYRHFVELSLKDMISTARALDDQEPNFPDTHRLRPLWSELRNLLSRVDDRSEPEDELLDLVGEMVYELDRTDPNSMSFRYPRGRHGTGRQPLLAEEYEYFDMRVFRDQAMRLAHFLEGCSTQLDEWFLIKRDLDREHGWE